MGLRFRKSVGFGKGIRLNFGKKGMSVTTGIRSAHVTYSTSGKKTTSFGIPGTGISYSKSEKIGGSSHRGFGFSKTASLNNYHDNAPMRSPNSGNKKRGCLTATAITGAVIVFLVVIASIFGGNESSSSSVVSDVASFSALTSSSEAALSSSVSSSTPVSSAVSSEPPSSAKASSAGKVSSAEPPKKAAEKSTEKTPAALTGISITQSPGTVQAGSKAILSIKGKPNTKYSIEVYYSTKASEAKGLSPQVSDSSGNVSWEWKVGPKTKAGKHRIVIQGGGDKIETYFTTTK
jgi:hypothetical protein